MFALPGQHVIHDLAQACRWLADASHGLQRLPFLGSWPGLQRQLQEVSNCLRAVGQRPVLLSHPSCHPLTCRFVGMLGRRLGLSVQQPELERLPLLMDRLDSRDVVIPYQVAENRYSDRLAALLAGHESGPQLLDPLLSWPSVRALVGQHLARIQ
ncbi:MAG: hypothetical protein ERJ69_02845 [Aphanocapsa feldmannii 288cV]|nr:MAG: hypothetical protein ERJ69_02845 [Aphanocapsa feldmannii 288cV]